MGVYIALFRGINVGGSNILPMKELKNLLEGLGCEKVQTYIQSGNVVFINDNIQRRALGRRISAGIRKQFGFEPKVMLLDKAELLDAVNENPYKTGEGKKRHFYFLDSLPENPDLDRLLALKSPSEEFMLKKNVFYLFAPDGIGRSKLAARVEQALGAAATARNWNTVSKLLSMIEEEQQ
jgi:uncharacterized protein (DUF1697 family)